MGKFSEVAINIESEKYVSAVRREKDIYKREGEIRSSFERDLTRILHCNAYRRLKHKTQVFFATENDHISTRVEHVHLVSSIGYTIAKQLGLNTELVEAIAVGHDLGHAPFGHHGEKVLNELSVQHIDQRFWHEKNSLRFVDKLETLPDIKGRDDNLNLTYAVRDGIVLHCGEVDETSLSPRRDVIDLETSFTEPGSYSPFTWEGCVVKIADKISYLGRDIEDAIMVGMINRKDILHVGKIIRKYTSVNTVYGINSTLLHYFITDLCKNSDPLRGIVFSSDIMKMMNELKKFNYEVIYKHPKIEHYKKHAENVLRTLFEILYSFYDGEETLNNIDKRVSKFHYPELTRYFEEHLFKYSMGILDEEKFENKSKIRRYKRQYKNDQLYDLTKLEDYIQAIIDFLSGMTDSFALRMFREATAFK